LPDSAMAPVFRGVLAVQWWQWPLVKAGGVLVVSGPSVLMAWVQARRRNLGPVLDANGWGVNPQARINIAFGTTLTQLARLPDGSDRALRDPYAPGPRLLPWLLVLLVVVGAVVLAVRAGWVGGAAMV